MHDSVDLILDYADDDNDNSDSGDSGESVSNGGSDDEDVDVIVPEDSVYLGAFTTNTEKKIPRA
jgi:hypothetical protein